MIKQLRAFYRPLQRFLSPKGVSLVEAMVGAGLLGGVALVGSQLFQDRFKQEALIEQAHELEDFHRNLQKIMNNVANCNATFRLFMPTDRIPPTGNDIKDIYLCGNNCTYNPVTKTGPEGNPATYVTAQGSPGNAFISKGKTYPDSDRQYVNFPSRTWRIYDIGMKRVTKTGRHEINIKYEQFPNTPKAKIVIKTLHVSLIFSNNNRFVSCASEKDSNIESLSQAMCEAIERNIISNSGLSDASPGNARPIVLWNSQTKRCEIQSSSVRKDCATNWQNGLAVDGIRADGKVVCESLTRDVDPNTLFNETEVHCNGGQRPRPVYNSTTKQIELGCTP